MNRLAGVAVLVMIVLFVPRPAGAQLLFDLAAAWGEEEHTIDVGGGFGVWHLTLVVGVAAVERGLQPGHEWTPDRTRVIETATGRQVDPRDARTTPSTRLWARLEYQPDWWGVSAMRDPRKHGALGAFAGVGIVDGMEGQGEVRWVHTLGWLLAFRLRFR